MPVIMMAFPTGPRLSPGRHTYFKGIGSEHVPGDGAGEAVAAAALALVGAPFRLHGREAASGLDCIGVIAAALRAAGWRGVVPTGYGLRGGDPAVVAAAFDAVLARCDGAAVGDVLLFRVGPGQLHGAVRTESGAGAGFVHADAGLGQVVERPGGAAWPLLGCWRYGEGG